MKQFLSKRRLVSYLLVMILSSASAQNDIGSFVKLDTILTTGIKIDNENVAVRDLKMRVFDGHLWIYVPNWKENDSLTFLKINLRTGTKEWLAFYLPGISFKILSPRIFDFDVNHNSLVFLFFNNCFAHLKKTNGKYIFDFIEPTQFTFNCIRLLGENKLLIYSNYNNHPKSNPDKTVFHVYDLSENKVLNSLRPNFTAIEFCHFSPNRWLDVNNKNIVFSQTTSYSISFFDFKLQETSSFKNADTTWVFADTTFIKGLESLQPVLSPKDFIEKLSPMEDTICRIEAIYCLGDSKILVRKIPYQSKKQNRLRIYDVLAHNKKTNLWELQKTNLIDQAPDMEKICRKETFPVNSVYSDVLFVDEYFIKILPRFTPFQYGISFKQNKDNEEKALGKSTPEVYVEIFKTNFN